MHLTRALEIKRYLEEELLTKPLNLVKSAALHKGFDPGRYLEKQDPVNGIGIGRGNRRDACYVEIMLSEKIKTDAGALADFFNVTSDSVRFKYVGDISALKPTERHRPAFPGISIGHFNISAGTFGCLTVDGDDTLHILSNNHVLADLDGADTGDPVLQPGPADGGSRSADTIAELSEWVPIDVQGLNRVDAALAKPLDSSDVSPEIPDVGRVKGLTSPRLNDVVMKSGRTTGHTSGTLTGLSTTVKVKMGEHDVLFEDQISVEGEKEIERFSEGGDSGSLIMDKERRAIGLLFAGSATGVTFANPINDVLSKLSVEII